MKNLLIILALLIGAVGAWWYIEMKSAMTPDFVWEFRERGENNVGIPTTEVGLRAGADTHELGLFEGNCFDMKA